MAGSFLVVTWAGGGNVGPFVVLAEALVQRGHRVGALAPAPVQARLAAVGCTAVAEPVGFLVEGGEVVAAVEASAADVVVVDYMLTAGLCGAEATGRPTAALVHTLYAALLRDGAPIPIEMAGSVEAVNDWRADLGLDLVDRHGELLDRASLVAVTSPASLDVDADLPANVRYTGLVVEGAGPDAGWAPPAGDGPLVAVSLGTAGADPANEQAVLRRILTALAGLPVRGVVNLPPYLDRSALDVPPNVSAEGYVRHGAVLRHADVLVTHAGLGSVHAALAHGVPMVALPLDREQPANAAAVERIGAGLALDPSVASAAIAAAIARTLASPRPEPLRPDAAPLRDAVEALRPIGSNA